MSYFRKTPDSFLSRVLDIYWSLVILLMMTALIGVLMLYSVADGAWTPWAMNHLLRFLLALFLMFICALIPIRIWYRLSYPLYIMTLLLLIVVDIFGVERMGAQRWLDLGIFNLQPSEFMKITLVLALARYYYDVDYGQDYGLKIVFIPLIMTGIPFLLILRQPDLGTALLLLFSTGIILFLSGISWRVIGIFSILLSFLIPIFVLFGLHDYQRQRIMTFLNPQSDPLDSGYHIIQSKIAIGSGGLSGKGYLQGTQSHLDFLPEKHTDFIFTMIAEEFGFIGSMGLLSLYVLIILCCGWLAWSFKNKFSRLASMGITASFFLYVFINIAMVTGLAPVVGVPMPLVSYGGSVMMTIMAGFGILLSARIYRHSALPKKSIRF